ncbi:hypothetical protein HJC23_004610 [Cyclotella cryptica]|uniref:Uncharacterized protein n=1 Tax=Cyclotella cryptica TaxID=29204 RepID=A0ABD3QEN9_9STRA
MARPQLGFLLINVLGVLLVTCGTIHQRPFSSVSAAAAGRLDQPEGDEIHRHGEMGQSADDHACESNELNEFGECETPFHYPPQFSPGDIIELFNTESRDIQIVFPSIVNGRVSSDSGTVYHITKTTDGRVVNSIPEKHLHPYVPYAIGSEALCNIGEFSPPDKVASLRARPIIVQCTVLEYEPAAEKGAMVLQGKYEVRVKDTRVNEEYITTVPVWKMQRRYLATVA